MNNVTVKTATDRDGQTFWVFSDPKRDTRIIKPTYSPFGR